jgi:exoribonuclease II
MDRTTKEEKIKQWEAEGKAIIATLNKSFASETEKLDTELSSWRTSPKVKQRVKEVYAMIPMVLELIVTEELNVKRLRLQIETQNEMVQKVADKVDVDLTDLKAKVEAVQKTIETPAFAEVAEFVKALKEGVTKTERAKEDYVD